MDTPNGEKLPIVYGENDKNNKPVPKYTSPAIAKANTLPEGCSPPDGEPSLLYSYLCLFILMFARVTNQQ